MKTTQKTMGVIAVLALASPAFGMIQVETDGNVQFENNTKSTKGEIINLSNDTNTRATTTLDGDVQIMTLGIDGKGDLQAGVEAQSGVNNNTEVQTNINTKAESGANATTQTQKKAMISLSGLATEENIALENQAEVMMQNNARITAVTSQEDEVTMRYSEPVVVLGFFSSTMERGATARVNNNSEVEVHVSKPWWNFMVTSEVKSSADVESDITTSLNGRVSSNSDVNTYAEIMTAMESAFDAMVSATAQSETTLDANTDVYMSSEDVDINSQLDANTTVDRDVTQKLQAGSETRTDADSDIRY